VVPEGERKLEKHQFVLEGFEPCGCWVRRGNDGLTVAGYACPECVSLALVYLEDLLYLDKVGSVSALEAEAERTDLILGIEGA